MVPNDGNTLTSVDEASSSDIEDDDIEIKLKIITDYCMLLEKSQLGRAEVRRSIEERLIEQWELFYGRWEFDDNVQPLSLNFKFHA